MKIIEKAYSFLSYRHQLSLLEARKDYRWLLIWFFGLSVLWIWDIFFLNQLSYNLIKTAVFNTTISVTVAVMFSLFIGWGLAFLLVTLETNRKKRIYFILIFIINLIRSIPQIIGLLIGYILLTQLILKNVLTSQLSQLLWMAIVIGIFCSIEIFELISERIAYFRKSDYFNAMLCCGIKESRIINIEILWKSSRAHLIQKIVSQLGVVALLQCSIDFIISVGLSTDVSLSNFPVTLGSLLAKLDSKQDILAFGTMFLEPSYISEIFFQHLQGVSIAFIIVFTLLAVYKISDGLVEYYDL